MEACIYLRLDIQKLSPTWGEIWLWSKWMQVITSHCKHRQVVAKWSHKFSTCYNLWLCLAKAQSGSWSWQLLHTSLKLSLVVTLFSPAVVNSLIPDVKMCIVLTHSPYISYGTNKENLSKISHLILGDFFLYCYHLKVWTSSDDVKKNFIFVTVKAQGVKPMTCYQSISVLSII